MSDDVLITPASRKVEFFDSGGNIDGKIELSTAGDLNITSTGKITIGDITQDIHIGDGTQAVDLVFDFASSIYSVANQDLTIGKGSLGGNDVIIDGAGAVLLSLAGTEQARLTSTGLGIGTTSPVSALDLSTGALSFANTYTQLKLSGGSNVDLQLGHWGNAHILIDTDGNDGSRYFAVSHGNATAGSATELMRVQENGNVGIGTTSPAAPLDIKSGGSGSRTSFNAVANDLVVDSTGDTGITISSANTSTGNVFFADSDNDARGQIRYDHAGNTMRFSTSGAEVMRLGSNGNVGIGTTSPGNILDVEESVNGDAQIRIENTNSGGNANAATVGIVADGNHLTVASYGDSHASLANYNRITTGASSAVISIDSGTVGQGILVADGGNVGIGTTSPSVPLEVNGEIKGSKINLSSGTDAFTIQSSNPAREKKIYATTSGDGSPFDEMVYHSEGSTGGWSGQHTFTVSKSEDDDPDVFSPYTAFRIRDSGNGTSSEGLVSHKLGVGILDPVPMLHIYGDNTTTNQTTSGAASITIENDGTGDVAVNYLLTGIRRWITGIDNSDADKFKISTGGTDIATGSMLTIDTSGDVVIAGDVQAATGTITGLMTSGTALLNGSHSFSNTPAITTNGAAINGTNTTKVRAESSTYSFSQSYILVGNLSHNTELELFRFNVTNASYRKFQAGRMYIRVQVTNPQSGGSAGFFQQTVTFGDDASGGAAQSTTDRIDSSMTGGNAAYDHEKATIVVSRVSDYICVKFRNDTGHAILTSSGFQAQLSCELFELDAMPA